MPRGARFEASSAVRRNINQRWTSEASRTRHLEEPYQPHEASYLEESCYKRQPVADSR